MFHKLKDELVRPLCPTRWTMRAASLQSVVENWVALQGYGRMCWKQNYMLKRKAVSLVQNIKWRHLNILLCFSWSTCIEIQ